jgi:hypothetical protein
VADGAPDVALDPETEAEVAPGSRFEVVLGGAWHDVRLALHDAADAMVAATVTRDVGAGETRLLLAPAAPLAPAGHYRLRVTGATAREPRGGDGATASPADWLVVVAVEPPPPRPARRR